MNPNTKNSARNLHAQVAIIAKVKMLVLAIAVILGFANAALAGYFPIPLTPGSFTYDIVVESNYPAFPSQQSINVTMDSGPGTGNNTWFEQGLDLQNSTTAFPYGLPHANSLVTNRYEPNHIYQMPPTYIGNDVVFIGNYTNIPNGFNHTYQTGSFTPIAPASYTALSLLMSGGNGPVYMTCTISFQDGTTEVTNLNAPDWFGGFNSTSGLYTGNNTNNAPVPVYCMSALGRATTTAYNNVNNANQCLIWSEDVALNDSSAVTNVSFTWVAGGRCCIFSLSGSTGSGFNPIAVTGYDGDAVIEATPLPLPYNATMDNGTNINSGGAGANTWFEQGWDTNRPTVGFPAHGTTITSISTGRQYQMAASYQGPMSILIDTNHQTVNITPATPQALTAISLLTCGASIGAANVMTNKIILQHQNGFNETNVFLGFDWFNNNTVSAGVPVVVAYGANGRANFNAARSLQNDTNLPYMDPRIFESQFQLLDTTSPITNIVCKYFTAGGVNWTTYVLAVAGSTDPVPVVLGPLQSPAAQNVYAGQTAQFQTQVLYGTAPTYQWQEGSSYYGPFTNITDGPTGTGSTISGTLTPNLTIANVSASDVAYYTCLVTNSVTTNVQQRTPAPLTLLINTSADIPKAGDPITEFGNAYPTPAGLGIANAIDSTMATYLNYGHSGTNSGPFVGPVGFVVTPSAGNSIVTGVRFVTAVNAAICDPADFMLEGSEDGTNWTTIETDTNLSLSDARNLQNSGPINITNQVLQEVDFANSTGYNTYRLTVNNVKSNSAANSMQIAEVQFLGSLSQVAPGVWIQPSPTNATLFAGATYTVSCLGNGPGPNTYQWYLAGNPISGATNTTYTKSNVSLADAGNYYCLITNPYGSTPTVTVTLNVVSPSSPYASTVVGDHPVAYWPMNEGPDAPPNDGTAMIDYVNSHDGYYTNVNLQQGGYSANDPSEYSVAFGEIDTNASFGGIIQPPITFATPAGSNGTFSVEAWVNADQQGSGYVANAGAGIVCLGYGGGGEQFALDCGGTSNTFRFYFREAGGTSHPAVAPSTLLSADGNWHHLVGVVDEPNKKEYFWVDGQLAQMVTLSSNIGVLADNAPTNRFTIGYRNGTDTNAWAQPLQFHGKVDEVSIYNYALSSNQVVNHYLSAGFVPVFTTQPTNVSVSEGANATFTAVPFGTQPVSEQWYQSGVGPIAGATNNSLTLTFVTASQNGNQYYMIATNSYGSAQSSTATLTVVSGPPVVETDLPSSYSSFAGSPVVLSTAWGGTAPLSYQWQRNGVNLSNGGRISGATSNVLTIANAQTADGGNYQLIVTNTYGSSGSTVCAVTIAPTLGFFGTGVGWTQQGTAGPALFQGNNVLELTFNQGGEANSAFFGTPVYVGGFEASWIYQVVNPNSGPADGVTFVVQNDPRGAAALGGGGGTLGVGGITPSVELEFNIYSPNTVGYSFDANGAIGPFTFPTPVNISDGNQIAVNLTYLDGKATMSLKDLGNNNTFSTSVNVNLPQIVGTNIAYVGFTGSDGGATAQQQVSNFSFISLIDLSATVSGNNLVLNWPVGTGGYVVQQSPSLNPPSWTAVNQPITQSGGMNQVTVPISGTQMFYQLSVP